MLRLSSVVVIWRCCDRGVVVSWNVTVEWWSYVGEILYCWVVVVSVGDVSVERWL